MGITGTAAAVPVGEAAKAVAGSPGPVARGGTPVASGTPALGHNLLIDMQPILPRTPESLWGRAERERDALYQAMQDACARCGADALVIKSGPFVQPAWVKFECWVPCDGKSLTERASGVIRIEPKPFHRFEFIYTVEVQDRGRTWTQTGLMGFGAADVTALVAWLLRHGPKPRFGHLQLRRFGWELWKPINKVQALGTDWPGLLPVVPLVVAIPLFASEAAGLGVVLILVAVVGWVLLARRQTLVRSAGRPAGEPRELVRVDSWQTVVSGLGPDAPLLRDRFVQVLRHGPRREFRAKMERIWHWGLDGKEEREQLVLSLGRGMFFLQMYAYDKELYVGWDAHLNVGQWVEKTLAKGTDKASGRLALINTVEPGVQRVTEYDVTDLSCLIEWAHAKLTAEVKHLMEERKIDQEVDFKILRGERQKLTEAGRPEGGIGGKIRGAGKVLSNAMGTLRRTG